MKNVSIIIHSYNSDSIIECVMSAKLLTNNIFVIGEDKKQQVLNDLKKMDVIFILFSNQEIVEPVREFGISQAKTNWVFLLDADERMTTELAQEIKSVISHSGLSRIDSGVVPTSGGTPQNDDNITHYKIPRKEIIFEKQWLKHGGWWPNYQTRLIKKSAFISWPKTIHSTPVINGQCGYLKNSLLHYSQNDIEEVVNRTINFESKESYLLFEAGKQANVLIFFRKFLGELWRRLLIGTGFLDGEIGIIESIYQAFSKTITYIFLYEKRIKKNLPAGRQGSTLRSLP